MQATRVRYLFLFLRKKRGDHSSNICRCLWNAIVHCEDCFNNKIRIWFLTTQGKLLQRLQKKCFRFGTLSDFLTHTHIHTHVPSMSYTYSLKVILCHAFSAPGVTLHLLQWDFLLAVSCWHIASFGFGGPYDFWFFRFGIPNLSSWWLA